MRKKLAILLVAVSTFIAFWTINANAASEGTYGDTITWTLDDEGTLVISGEGDMDAYREFNREDSPFYYNSDIKEIIIESGITSIGDSTFFGCGVRNVTLPNTVRSIGFQAFECCDNLIGIKIPDSVTAIYRRAFANCYSLSDIAIPDSVTILRGDVFSHCHNLKSAVLPNNITEIESYTFNNCTSLTDIVLPSSVTAIGSDAFSDCTALKSIVIPESVSKIGAFAFSGCTSLENITLPDSFTNFESSAFNNTAYYNNPDNWDNGVLYINKTLIKGDNNRITSHISVKYGTVSITDGAFVGCSNLEGINIPNSIKDIGSGAFLDCGSLTSVVIPDSVTAIYAETFKDCTSLSDITLPDSIKTIGSYAFYNTAYYNNKDNWDNDILYINKALIDVENNTLITDVEIKEGTKVIAYAAFNYCPNIKNIIIPDSITKIEAYTFNNCRSLESITIPDSITYIGSAAFNNCNKLSDVYYDGTKTQWKSISIDNSYNSNVYLTNATIHFKIEPCFIISQSSDSSEVTNTDDEQHTVAVIISEYENGILKALTSSNEIFIAGEKKTYDLSENGQYKVFVWDSLYGMQPLNK